MGREYRKPPRGREGDGWGVGRRKPKSNPGRGAGQAGDSHLSCLPRLEVNWMEGLCMVMGEPGPSIDLLRIRGCPEKNFY